MLVQTRERSLRLVRQHDHALAAGRLAHAWLAAAGGGGGRVPRDGDPGERAGEAAASRRLPFRLVLAVALHDVAWRELDRRPRLDPESGRPFGFEAHPLPEKLEAYAGGLDEMEAVDPWVGLLGSLHYASFLDGERAEGFLRREEARRERIREVLDVREGGGGGAGTAAAGVGARHGLRWLKFFDGLSLRLCLAPPGVPEGSLPPWLEREGEVVPPEGAPAALRWDGPDRATLDPFPLDAPVRLGIPYRQLPARRYRGPDGLARAWEAAPERTWRPVLSPPPGGEG